MWDWHYSHHCVQSRGKVIGIDLTPELLERAKEDAALAGVTEGIEWKQGDAEDLPFADNSFDIVFSSVGHMFTPRPEVLQKSSSESQRKGAVSHLQLGLLNIL